MRPQAGLTTGAPACLPARRRRRCGGGPPPSAAAPSLKTRRRAPAGWRAPASSGAPPRTAAAETRAATTRGRTAKARRRRPSGSAGEAARSRRRQHPASSRLCRRHPRSRCRAPTSWARCTPAPASWVRARFEWVQAGCLAAAPATRSMRRIQQFCTPAGWPAALRLHPAFAPPPHALLAEMFLEKDDGLRSVTLVARDCAALCTALCASGADAAELWRTLAYTAVDGKRYSAVTPVEEGALGRQRFVGAGGVGAEVMRGHARPTSVQSRAQQPRHAPIVPACSAGGGQGCGQGGPRPLAARHQERGECRGWADGLHAAAAPGQRLLGGRQAQLQPLWAPSPQWPQCVTQRVPSLLPQAMKEFRLTDKDLSVGAGFTCTTAGWWVLKRSLWVQCMAQAACCPSKQPQVAISSSAASADLFRACNTPRGATPSSGTAHQPRCERREGAAPGVQCSCACCLRPCR